MVRPVDQKQDANSATTSTTSSKISKDTLGRSFSTKRTEKTSQTPSPSAPSTTAKSSRPQKVSQKPKWSSRISAAVAKLFSRKSEYSKETQNLVKELVRLSKNDPEAAGKKLVETEISGEELDSVVKLLMSQIKDVDTQAKIVIGASKQEIQQHKGDHGTLLRGNTVASKLLGAFNDMHIMPLFAKSKPLIQALSRLPSNTLLEQADVEKRTSDILDEIIKVLSAKNSPELKAAFTMLNEVQKAANKHFPNEKPGDAVALNLVFLRGVNPGIAAPQSKHFPVEYKGMQSQNAKPIAKIIQNLVNGVEFEKEPSMIVFNDFLRQKQNVLNDLKQRIFI